MSASAALIGKPKTTAGIGRNFFAALSFRPLLLLVFLLIVLPLCGTSIHALFTLKNLATESKETAQSAIHLTEIVQQLGERTTSMERSARQYLILADPAFEEIYKEAAADAHELLDAMAGALPGTSQDAFIAWRNESKAVQTIVKRHAASDIGDTAELGLIFGRLAAINNQLALDSKTEVERRNQLLLDDLERRQGVLSVMVFVTMLLAAVLAIAFGLWLSRSLSQIGSAIGRLGESRFDQAIWAEGPADLRALAEQLDWLRLRLAGLENDKARFLRHVSHELKTPLAALSEGVALLNEGVVGTLSPQQQEIVRILRQNTLALQTQIEDLLRYNAAAFEGQQLRRTPIELEKLLHQVVDTQRLQWQARGVTVTVEGEAQLVKADVDKLTVALSNLLSNAIRFSEAGNRIRFVLSREGNRVRLDCMDDGPGVDAADRQRIFEPFYQGKNQPPGPRRGSGIGLSIVREYIEAHQGSVQLLDSERGAHFRIELAHEN